MKLIFVFVSILSSAAIAAEIAPPIPAEMTVECEKTLDKVIGQSIASSHYDIIDGLKYDWKQNPNSITANYDDCGPSDFYYVKVNKLTCTITSEQSGDSDGECQQSVDDQ